MGAESGERSSGRSPFVPVLMDDYREPPPFLAEPYGAYASWLAEIDEAATWARMLSPGNSGVALAVTAVNPFTCCTAVDLRNSLRDNEGFARLYPGLVHWRSLFPRGGHLAPTALDAFRDGLDFPPVGVVEHDLLAFGMQFTNLVYPDDDPWDEYGVAVDDGLPVLALAPPWQLLPITEEAEALQAAALTNARIAYRTDVLGMTNCELVEYSHEPSAYGAPIVEHREDCLYRLGDDLCSCDLEPTLESAALALYDTEWPEEELFLAPELRAAWSTLLTRYFAAWELIAHRAFVLGDAWSTFCWQRLSPFSDTSSLDLQHRAWLERSTASPTSPVSPPGSSPQLTLFAS